MVIFYSNDLSGTPSHPIMDGTSPEAIKCVHGLSQLQRWTGVEVLHRTKFDVPTIIVAYNRYMNCIDRLDQGLATAPTKHKEIRLQMTMFTFFLDLCVSQAYALYKKIHPKEKVMMTEFKRRLCEKLVTNYTTTISSKTAKKRKASNEVTADERPYRCPIPSQLETCHSSGHTLLPNIDGRFTNCHLCYIRGVKDLKTNLGCEGCGKCYHQKCFVAYHYRSELTGSVKALMEAVAENVEDTKLKYQNRKAKMVSALADLELPLKK